MQCLMNCCWQSFSGRSTKISSATRNRQSLRFRICRSHKRRHSMAKLIPLTHGACALVDDGDYDRLMQHKWFLSRSGYAIRHVWTGEKSIAEHMHRVVIGADCNGFDVDHINGDPLDNRRCNLRIATRSQNMANARAHRDGSGYKGITFDKRRNKYFARICINYKTRFLGYYDTAEEAAEAYNKAAVNTFGVFSKLNKL